MRRSQILAHRGWHYQSNEKNSQVSIERALKAGFGIETDLRDYNQKVVISHDPPTDQCGLLSLEWLLRYAEKIRANGQIALNIKSDGLAPMISENLRIYKNLRKNIYVFDASVPDALQYIFKDINTYSRVSEYEEMPSYGNIMSGVWIDNFGGGFPQTQSAKYFINKGISVTIVSSELHGRCHEELWRELKEAKLHLSPILQLCTDLPDRADAFFSEA